MDMAEARALSYNNDIYTKSWGPYDDGFIVGGPSRLAEETLSEEVKQVILHIIILW